MTNGFIPDTAIVEYVELIGYNGSAIDITDLVQSIDIYESIYNSTISGYINVIDSNDLPQFFPIIGGEILNIEIKLPHEDDYYSQKFTFIVYKMSDRKIANNSIQNYKLWFTSKETITNSSNRVSKSYKETTVSNIVGDIYSKLETDKNIDIDTTIGLIDYIAPSIRPFEVIHMLTKHYAINNEYADFIFFESIDPYTRSTQFNFKSISNLFSKTATTVIPYRQKNIENNPLLYKDIPEKIEFKKSFDLLENKANGLYSQTVIHHDLLRKRFEMEKIQYDDMGGVKADGEGNIFFDPSLQGNYSEFIRYNISSSFPSSISINKHINNNRIPSAPNKRTRNDNNYINTHKKESLSPTISSLMTKRSIQLQEMENNKIFLNGLSGNTKFSVGGTVEFDKPHIVHNLQSYLDRYGDNSDMLISGKYLITKTRHSFIKVDRGFDYKNYLEISKNSFKNSITSL